MLLGCGDLHTSIRRKNKPEKGEWQALSIFRQASVPFFSPFIPQLSVSNSLFPGKGLLIELNSLD